MTHFETLQHMKVSTYVNTNNIKRALDIMQIRPGMPLTGSEIEVLRDYFTVSKLVLTPYIQHAGRIVN